MNYSAAVVLLLDVFFFFFSGARVGSSAPLRFAGEKKTD
jgi:hypothetical protein